MATESRLALIAPDLEEAVSPSNARTIALLAVQSALDAHPARDAVVQESLVALQAGDWRRATAQRDHVERDLMALMRNGNDA